MNCKIAEDRLLGVKAIAEEMGETERQVRYGIDTGRFRPLKRAAYGALRVRCCASSIGQECGASANNGADNMRTHPNWCQPARA